MTKENETKMGNANVGLVNNKFYGAYETSFGPMASETHYHGGEMKSMIPYLRKGMIRGRKALTSITGGTASTDYVLSPIYVDQAIVDISRKFTPFVEMIPRVSNKGRTADYDRLTAKGAAVMKGEDAALSDVSDTYGRVSKPIKYLYSVGRVTGQANRAQPPFMIAGFTPQGDGASSFNFAPTGPNNALAKEVLIRARALKELEEDKFWNGSISSDSNEFDGIVTLQSGTNETTLSAALGLDNLETAIAAARADRGHPNVAGASVDVVKDIRNLLRDSYRYSPSDLKGTTGLPYGFPAQLIYDSMVGPIPIIPSDFLNNTSGSKSIYFLDTFGENVEMRVLQDMTYEKLAKTNDSDKFMLKMYEVPIVRGPEFNADIISIT